MKKGCLVIVGILCLLFILGIIGAACSNSGGDSDKSSNSSTTATVENATVEKEVKKDGITYDKFMSIKMGSSYKDVVAIVGQEGNLSTSNSVGNVETKLYEWNEGLSSMNCMFQNGKLVNKAMASLDQLVEPNGKDITIAQFNQIQNGMSYEAVKKILGREGFIMSEGSMMGISTKIYCWMNKGGANMEVTFQNDGVSMKNQMNLK